MPTVYPSVSVVVLTCNRPRDVELSILSVVNQDLRPSELILVDDGDLDPSGIQALVEAPGIKFIYHHKDRRGIARSRNAGARLSSGELIMYLDDDERMEPGYIRTMAEIFKNDREGAIVGATPARVEGTGDEAGYLDPLWHSIERIFLLRGSGHRILLSGFNSSDYYSFTEPTDVEFMSGTATYRRRVFDSYRFDEELERYGPYAFGEDLAFSFKTGSLGRRIMVPDAKIAHHRSKLSRPASGEMAMLSLHNHYYIYRRYLRNRVAHPLAFAWAIFGKLVLSLLRFLSKPSRYTWNFMRGTVAGALLVSRMALRGEKFDQPKGEGVG